MMDYVCACACLQRFVEYIRFYHINSLRIAEMQTPYSDESGGPINKHSTEEIKQL